MKYSTHIFTAQHAISPTNEHQTEPNHVHHIQRELWPHLRHVLLNDTIQLTLRLCPRYLGDVVAQVNGTTTPWGPLQLHSVRREGRTEGHC